MEPLASLPDLKSYLRLSESNNTRDGDLSRALAATSGWIRERTRQSFDGTDARVERGLFRGPRTIRLRHLPIESLTEVRVGSAGQTLDEMSVLTSSDALLLDEEDGRVRIRTRTSGREPDVLHLAYQGGQLPPPEVREACVLIAAFLAESMPQIAGGLASSRSFEIRQTFERRLPTEALLMLAGHRRARTLWT